MNILLWIIQILLALLFLFAGGTKLVMSMEEMQRMGSPNQVQLPELFIRFIGVVEVLGALGLVLPGIFRIRKGLTALAATGLAIIMVGAVIITIAGGGPPITRIAMAITPLVVGVLCAFVAYGRGVKHW
ncbi:MAG TPA: DoxX family protein [Pyrinomonadaceae bacterium]|jgi:uncharacterized membrane protein YphA (DoxX/SURF4 family)|nr:DoxX family protein [Pyrinomonadaceae bacterium]